jgi:hypothetical protein
MPDIYEKLRKKYMVKGRALKEAKALSKSYPGEVCFFCGVLIGKDYGSFSHECSNLTAYKRELREVGKKKVEDFVKWMKEAKEAEFKLMDDKDEVGMITVPVLNYHASWNHDPIYTCFEVPAVIDVDGVLYERNYKVRVNDEWEYQKIEADWSNR